MASAGKLPLRRRTTGAIARRRFGRVASSDGLAACRTQVDAAATEGERFIFHRFFLTYFRYAQLPQRV